MIHPNKLPYRHVVTINNP